MYFEHKDLYPDQDGFKWNVYPGKSAHRAHMGGTRYRPETFPLRSPTFTAFPPLLSDTPITSPADASFMGLPKEIRFMIWGYVADNPTKKTSMQLFIRDERQRLPPEEEQSYLFICLPGLFLPFSISRTVNKELREFCRHRRLATADSPTRSSSTPSMCFFLPHAFARIDTGAIWLIGRVFLSPLS